MLYILSIWTHAGRVAILREEMEQARQEDLAGYPEHFHPIVNRIWDEAAEKYADRLRPSAILSRIFTK